MKDLGKLVVAIAGCELVGFAATPFTLAAIPTWYQALNKPIFSPPNWVFGPVWTILYCLMGISAYLVWKKGLRNNGVKVALTYFLMQLALNFLWSVIFFGLHLPLLAFIEIVILWLFIFVTMKKFAKISRDASYLLIPYIIWVSFAAILNISIVILNR